MFISVSQPNGILVTIFVPQNNINIFPWECLGFGPQLPVLYGPYVPKMVRYTGCSVWDLDFHFKTHGGGASFHWFLVEIWIRTWP